MNSFSGRMARQNGEESEREPRGEREQTWAEVVVSGRRPRAGKGLSQPSPVQNQNEEGSSLLSAADTTVSSSKSKKRDAAKVQAMEAAQIGQTTEDSLKFDQQRQQQHGAEIFHAHAELVPEAAGLRHDRTGEEGPK